MFSIAAFNRRSICLKKDTAPSCALHGRSLLGDDELGDLENGDVLLPPDANATRGLEVVPVHDNVDGEVEGDDDPGNGGVAEELGVAEKSGGTVVVGVEEGQGLLLEDEEDGVNQLEVLGEVVELGNGC